MKHKLSLILTAFLCCLACSTAFAASSEKEPKITLDVSPAAITQHDPQDVTFTVMINGMVLGSASVIFADNPHFTNLSTAAQETDSNGQITLNNLTATALGSQTLSAIVNGQAVSVNIDVTPANYTLEASPTTLTQHIAQDVPFTVKRNGKALPDTPVIFASTDKFTNLPMTERITDSNGQVMVNNLTATTSGSQTLSAYVQGQTASVRFDVAPATVSLTPMGVTGGTDDFSAYTTASFTVNLTVNGEPFSGKAVTWSVAAADNSANLAVVSILKDKATGLAWGESATKLPGYELKSRNWSSTDNAGNASVQLTDIMGERTVTVQAQVAMGDTTHTVTQDVTFGNGPLSRFTLPREGNCGTGDWITAYAACNGTPYTKRSAGWSKGDYVGGPNMPTRLEILSVSAGSTYGAYLAAGWPSLFGVWTGEAYSSQNAFYVSTVNGTVGYEPDKFSRWFICRR